MWKIFEEECVANFNYDFATERRERGWWYAFRELIKSKLKEFALSKGYYIARSAPNRFEATDHCLARLARHGYRPRRVIDGGAHTGKFALLAEGLFPSAEIHMIEPQHLCQDKLRELVATHHTFKLHTCALSDEDGVVRFSSTPEDTDTGGHVADTNDSPESVVSVDARRLDSLFGSLDTNDRTFAKFDLEGHELPALTGGLKTLATCEFVLIEVTFFWSGLGPTPEKIIALLDREGFALYDISSASSRRRDDRLRQCDLLFVRRTTPFWTDTARD